MKKPSRPKPGSASNVRRKPANDPVFRVPHSKIYPSPENDQLYHPPHSSDSDIIALAESIRKHGIKEPIVITADSYIVSGHRRYLAALIVGLKTVLVRRLLVKRKGNRNFVKLLREFNRQRVKTRDEQLREEIVSANPDDAYQELRQYQKDSSAVKAHTIHIRPEKRRHQITSAKLPFLNAIQHIIECLRPFWPLSDRQIHYQLLNDPPLTHAQKSESVYRNNPRSYKSLSELLTRARHEGKVPFNVIHDPTRPETLWQTHRNVGDYYGEQIAGMFRGYARDLQQSQPNHIEIVAEKNTVQNIIEPIASEYRIPLTIGRGFCSTPPKYRIAERFRLSNKANLVILALSDFDPDGEEIAHSLVRSLRDDFGISGVTAIKVALTVEQIREERLPEGMLKAKPSSPNYRRFRDKYGNPSSNSKPFRRRHCRGCSAKRSSLSWM